MTLTDLLTDLSTRGVMKPSRVPAMKTSLKYLAEALGHVGPEQCPADVALRQEATWATALETHFGAQDRAISVYTRRNVRNDIRKIFKLAEASGLLTAPLPSRLLPRPDNREAFEHQLWATSPYTTTYRPQSGPRHFGLRLAEWPPDVQAGWRAYRTRCGLRIRETTFKKYADLLGLYLGYVAYICGRPPRWDDVFAVAIVEEFVRWHAARHQRPITTTGRAVALFFATLAKVLEDDHASALAAFARGLKPPTPLHTKRAHWVSLATLEQVADACLADGRRPVAYLRRTKSLGVNRTTHFQKGVMLKLLVRVPLRQRNVRELQLDKHLYRDPTTGHWHLHLSGDDLKIGTRGGRVNEYKLNLTEETDNLVPVLEEFLRDYRPRLPNAATSPFLFLTKYGNPFAACTVHEELRCAVAMHTGQRFYPHLIRTIWATEYLTSDEKPDWLTAAVMLGDKVSTVMARYHDLVDQAHHPKARAFVARQLRTG